MNTEVMRIFVGCDPNDCDLEQMMVLDYSLRKHASLPLQIHWMRLSADPESFWYSDPAAAAGWQTRRWATPFSGFRWAIPAYCGYQGRAIYMDTDMIVLTDIARLWRAPIADGRVVVARPDPELPRFCVSMWDCERARAHLPSLTHLRERAGAHAETLKYFRQRPQLIEPLDPAFNNVDGENQPVERIGILHYSDMGTQFSHGRSMPRLAAQGQRHWFDGAVMPHPRADLAVLFEQTYAEAEANGLRPEDYRNPAPFGRLPKKSERDYAGNRVTRPKTRRSLWPFRL